MPQIGDTKIGRDIGKGNSSHRFMWVACNDCGKERWVHSPKGIPENLICIDCRNKKFRVASLNLNKGKHAKIYKGGFKTKQGYKIVYLRPDDFFHPMANRTGYVMEHRLVMAKSLGRNLHLWEIVHHKNHIKDDNRLENLQLVSSDKHKQITRLEERIKKLESTIQQLKAENKRLADVSGQSFKRL